MKYYESTITTTTNTLQLNERYISHIESLNNSHNNINKHQYIMARSKNVTLNELDNILGDRLGELERSLTANIAEIVSKNVAQSFEQRWGAQIQQNADDIGRNSAAIAELTARVEALEREKGESEKTIQTLHNDLDDVKNRNMRNNLIIKGLPEPSNGEKEDTRAVVINYLAELAEQDEAEIEDVVDRCHRGGRKNNNNNNNNINNKPRNIYMNFTSSRHVDFYIQKARTQKSEYKLERQFTKPVQDRRNAAMLHRRTLLDNKEITAGYLEYPATLMVKKPGDSKESKFKFCKAF